MMILVSYAEDPPTVEKKLRFSLSSTEIFQMSDLPIVEEPIVVMEEQENRTMSIKMRSFMLICINALVSTNLATPYAFSRVGWFSLILAPFLTCLIGGMVWMLVRILRCETVKQYGGAHGVGPLDREYGFLAEMLFGEKGRSMVTSIIGVQFFLTLISNMIAMGEAGSLLLRIPNGFCVLIFAFVAFAISVVPVYSQARSAFSIITPITLVVGLIALAAASIALLAEPQRSRLMGIYFYSKEAGAGDFFVLFGVIIHAFSNAFALPVYAGIIAAAAAGPKSVTNSISEEQANGVNDTRISATTSEATQEDNNEKVEVKKITKFIMSRRGQVRRKYFLLCSLVGFGCGLLYMLIVGVLGMHLCGSDMCPPNFLTILQNYQKSIPYGGFVIVYIIYIFYGFSAIPVLMTPLMAMTEASVVKTASVKLRILYRAFITLVVCGLAVALQNHLPQVYAIIGCSVTIALLFITPLALYLIMMKPASSMVVITLYIGITVASAAAILGTVFSIIQIWADV